MSPREVRDWPADDAERALALMGAEDAVVDYRIWQAKNGR